MEGFLHAVSSVTIILLLTATGYFCAARGWMGPDAKRFISKFTMSVAIPCMCVYGLTKNLTRELLALSPGFLLVPFLSTLGAFLLSLLAGKLLKLPRRKLGVFMMMCSVSNAIFIGLPMCTELFGDHQDEKDLAQKLSEAGFRCCYERHHRRCTGCLQCCFRQHGCIFCRCKVHPGHLHCHGQGHERYHHDRHLQRDSHY